MQLELLFTIPMCLGPVFDPVIFNGEQMDSAELGSPAENCGMCASGEPYLFLMSKGEGDHIQKTSGAFGVGPAGLKDVPGPDKGRTGCRSQLRAAWALWPAARSASDREKSQWNTPPRPHMQGCLINDKKNKQRNSNRSKPKLQQEKGFSWRRIPLLSAHRIHLCVLWNDAQSRWPLTLTFPVDLVPFQMQK